MSDAADPTSWNGVQRLAACMSVLVVLVGGVIAFSPVSTQPGTEAPTYDCGSALAERLEEDDLGFCAGPIHSRSNLGLLVAGAGLLGGFVLVSLLGDTKQER